MRNNHHICVVFLLRLRGALSSLKIGNNPNHIYRSFLLCEDADAGLKCFLKYKLKNIPNTSAFSLVCEFSDVRSGYFLKDKNMNIPCTCRYLQSELGGDV